MEMNETKIQFRLILHTFWLDICRLIRIWIPLINFDADPDFYLMRIRIQVTKMMRIQVPKMMRILADPYP